MKNFRNVLGAYKNGNYTVNILTDGTKIRFSEDDEFIPEFAENCDVKITDKCDGGCPFCYEGCTIKGKHAKLMNPDGTPYWNFLNTLKPYTELALNGNDLSHPELEDFLKFLKTKKIITNMTVNQKHFMKNLELLHRWTDEKLIYGLGVSLADASDPKFKEEILKFPNAVIHTIAGLLDTHDVYDLLVNAEKKLKILILGYKTLERGIGYAQEFSETIKSNQEWLKSMIKCNSLIDHFKVVSFDNLALEQLDIKNILFTGKENEWDLFYSGDDGSITYYIDMVKGQYSKNSCMPKEERYEIGNQSVIEMFNDIRNKYNK